MKFLLLFAALAVIIYLIWRWLMAQFSVNTHRFDPYRGHKFRVIWDGKVIPGISRVSALRRRTESVIHRNGTEPNLSRVVPGATLFEPLVLERGVTHDTAFEDWANLVFDQEGDAAMSLKNFRKDLVIQLLNAQGVVVKAYKVYRAWVSEYQPLPDMDANANAVAVEKLVLQHEGWERDTAVAEPAES